MSDTTGVEWTNATWNPVTGCSKVSLGCTHCYAETLSRRFGRSFEVTLHYDRIDQPLRWRKPRRIFVCSMGDLFHERVPSHFVRKVFASMAMAPQQTFQVLTKRPDRMHDWFCEDEDGYFESRWDQGDAVASERISVNFLCGIAAVDPMPWPLPNVWLGTSIENDRFVGRADALRETPAAVRFVSAEPLLGPLPSLDLTGIHWLIVGGESGPGHRPMDPTWVRDLVERADAAGAAAFVKQGSGARPGRQGNLPDDLWARKEYPP